jgi:hypothetical protein
MSQAGIVDFEGAHPEVPTLFVANVGSAVPIANTLEILGEAVTALGIPLQTVASGNTVNINVQYASAAASSVAGNAGVASFNSAQFTVDSNGYVTLTGTGTVESFTVDAFTAPGTNPVTPNGSGIVKVTGGQIAAGTTANVIRTNSLAANTYTIQIQRSQAVAVSTIGDNGVSHFNSSFFTVDANGFVSLNGSGVGETITGNVGGALSPTLGNWNIYGTSTAAGTTPVQTSGSVSTLTVQVQKAQAIAATNATNVGLAAFDSASFTVDANGFVQLVGSSAAIEKVNVQTGTSPIVPTSGAITINGATVAAGTHPVRTDGTGPNTMAVEVQISQAIASTDATKIGLAAFSSTNFSVDANGFVALSGTGALITLTGNTGGAISPTAGNINTLGTGSITIAGSGSTLTTQLTGLTNHNVLVGAGTATITNVAPSATSGVPLVSNGASSDPSFSTALIAGGGTASTSFNTTGVVISGATSTTALTAVTLTDGQLAIGSSAGNPAAATITAGTGISVTNGHNSITIDATGGSFAWVDVTTATQTLAIQTGYVTDHSGGVVYTLPATAAIGDQIRILGKQTSWSIAQNANQQILVSSASSTVGTSGSVASTNLGDCIWLVCITAGASTVWRAESFVGNLTVT